MKVLLLGFTSTVGYRFWETCVDKYTITSTYRGSLPNELTNTKAKLINTDYSTNELESIISQVEPDVVINTIGLTSPDYCESNKEICKTTNLDIVKIIADACKKHNSKLVHFSTHAVFDGSLDIYSEEDEHSPINYYGYCKSLADIYIRNNLKDFIILRPTAIISKKRTFQRGNILDFIIENIVNEQELNLIDSDCVNYTYLDDLVKILDLTIKSKMTGEFNIGGDTALNKLELGKMVAKTLNVKSNINEVSIESLNLPAKRANKTILDNSKIKEQLNFKFTPLKLIITNIYKKYKDQP